MLGKLLKKLIYGAEKKAGERRKDSVKKAETADEPKVLYDLSEDHPQLILAREKVKYMNQLYTVVKGVKPDAYLKTVEIPDGVVALERGCFSKCTDIEEVYIPDTAVYMDGEAFHGCTLLKSIRLSEAMTEIPFWCFRDCSSLKSIDLPKKIHRIGFCAFWNSGLERIEIPEGCETIQLSAFSICRSLVDVVLPESLREIEDSSFECTYSLSFIKLPRGLRSLGERAFLNSGLVGIELPPKLTLLNDRTFSGCKQLRMIYIPDNIKQIGREVFKDCMSLESVRLPRGMAVDDTVFEGCGSLKELTVGTVSIDLSRAGMNYPMGKLAAYIVSVANCGVFFDISNMGLGITNVYLTDFAYQFEKQGFKDAEKYVMYDIDLSLSCMASLDRPEAFDDLVGRGARLTAEQTDEFIERSIALERKEMYLSLLRYKRDILGFDTDGDDPVSGRFSL